MNLEQALLALDPEVTTNWTDGGLPLVTAVQALMQAPITRAQITAFAPEFNRDQAREFRVQAQVDVPVEENDAQVAPAAPVNTDDGQQIDPDPEPMEDEPVASAAVAKAGRGETPKAQAQAAASPAIPEDAITDEQLFKMPINDVLVSGVLRNRAMEFIGAKVDALAAQAAVIQKELLEWRGKGDALARLIDRMEQADPNREMKGIQAVLKRSTEARAQRHANALQFIQGGTTPKAVAELLRKGSPLDAAMARKTGYGGKRPVIPLMVATAAGQ